MQGRQQALARGGFGCQASSGGVGLGGGSKEVRSLDAEERAPPLKEGEFLEVALLLVVV